MNKKPRRIYISEERAQEEKKKNHYTELYVYDPDFLDEYKQIIVDSFKGNPTLQIQITKNMSKITEFVIGDRVKNGLSRLSCHQKQIHIDNQFVDLTTDSFSIKPGCEYTKTVIVHALLHAAARKKGLTGLLDYLKDENGKVIGRKNAGLNEGITKFLAEQITGVKTPDEIDSYAFNKKIVSLLEDTLGDGIMSASYFGDENLLKNVMNLMAQDPEYYDKFNKDLDTINKLQTTIRRIKNGSIKPKDPKSLERMEAVLASQQERLVESVFANVVIPAVQKQEKSVRQEILLPILLKHEPLLSPVAKYVVKHQNSDWISDNILESIKKEINEKGIDFEKIREASIKIVETKRTSAVTANKYMEAVDNFYIENESFLLDDNSTKLTPLLKRQLQRMVEVLDEFELVAETTKLESAKESLAQYKNFLKKYFHKIPNLEEEIERIREERKNPKKNINHESMDEPEEVRTARESGRKAAEEGLTEKSTTSSTTKNEDKKNKKDKKHPNLQDNYVVDNITGQIFNQQNKSIFEKAITITQATGKPLDIEDEVLVELHQKALSNYAASLDTKNPPPALVARYGNRWKEVLLEAYSEGWNSGISDVISQTTNLGMEERNKTIAELKKGNLPKEQEDAVVSLEEVETVYREIEIKLDANGNEVVVNRQTGQPIMSERTKKIAGFAEEWVKTNGEDAFEKESEETYRFIQNEVAINSGLVDEEKIIEDAEIISVSAKKTTEKLFASEKNHIVSTFLEMQQLTPDKLKEEQSEVIPSRKVPKKNLEKVFENLESASLEDINEHLNLYNGAAVELEDGSSWQPFNEPISAAKLNSRYKELTGKDHPVFVRELPKVVAKLLNDKELLIQSGAYKPEYFDDVEFIVKDLSSRHPELIQPEANTKTGHK